MTNWVGRFSTGWMSGDGNAPSARGTKSPDSGAAPDTGTVKVGGAMLLCIVLGIIGVAIALRSNGTIARGLLWAGAWSSIGWFLGFLFGIPRFLSTDTARTPESPGLETAKQQLVSAAAAAQTARAALDSAKEVSSKADQAKAKLAELVTAANEAAVAAAEALRIDINNPELQADAQNKAKMAADARADSNVATASANAAAAELLSKATATRSADAAVEIARSNVGSLTEKATTSRGPSVTVNTNLEQISDWLTKIIVGVSLVESQALLSKMHGAATFMARSMSKAGDAMPQPLDSIAALVPASVSSVASDVVGTATVGAAAGASAVEVAASGAGAYAPTAVAIASPILAPFYSLESVAYAVMLYFLATGLLGSYLLTRLYLQRVLQEAAGH